MLSTHEDQQMLKDWSFLRLYQHNWTMLVQVGKRAYYRLKTFSGAPIIFPQDVEELLTYMLLHTNVFYKACRSKWHVSPTEYPKFALAMARHILDHDWLLVAH